MKNTQVIWVFFITQEQARIFWYNSLMIILGFLLGFLFSSIFAGAHEGDCSERSLRFLVKGYYVHIHHWIYCSLILAVLFMVHFVNFFVIGVLIGAIIQGLLYRDRFVVFYKKEKHSTIYSRFK
jgi:hypothetical protein